MNVRQITCCILRIDSARYFKFLKFEFSKSVLQSSCILRRPQNFAKSSPYFWLALNRTKVKWRFCKVLWSSQNIWTSNSINKSNLTVTDLLRFVQFCKEHHLTRVRQRMCSVWFEYWYWVQPIQKLWSPTSAGKYCCSDGKPQHHTFQSKQPLHQLIL